MALDTACVSDILMQPMEFFPISSCNSWALSGLPTLPSLQRMSIGAAGVCPVSWASVLLHMLKCLCLASAAGRAAWLCTGIG